MASCKRWTKNNRSMWIYNSTTQKSKLSVETNITLYSLGWVWIARLAFGVCVFPLFFFWHAFVSLRLLFIYCSMNSNCKVWLFYFFSQSMHIVYCLWTHKFHFSATFLLKMGLTVLFTYLKIILLQYFSVFSFNFQFLVSSCIQTDP